MKKPKPTPPTEKPPAREKRRRRRAFGSITQVRVRGKTAPGFYVRYRVEDPDGHSRTVQKKAGATREEAEAELHRIAARAAEDAENRRAGRVRDVSIDEFASKEYLPGLDSRVSTAHIAHVISRIDAASRYFGDRPMRTIERADIEDFLAAVMRNQIPPRVELDENGVPKKPRRRRLPRSTNTQHHIRACLQPMWREAIARRAARINPFAGLHLPRMKEFAVPWINPAQLRKLLAACPPRIQAYVTFLANTGLRASEAATLRWTAVSPDFDWIEVVVSKSGKVRRVHLTPDACAVLRSLHAARGPIPLEGDPLVFPDLPSPNLRLQLFKRAAARVGLPATLRLHDLRHAFASHLAQSGIPLATIAELLGHGSLQMVQRYAKHVPAGAARQAIERLAAFRAAPGTPEAPTPVQPTEPGRREAAREATA